MATLVLTVVGADRAGSIHAVAEVVAANGGNWEQSQVAELAGKFAGIVVVTAPDASVDALIGALKPLHGLVEFTADVGPVQPASAIETTARFSLDLVGADRRGIVNEITDVLAAHRVNMEMLRTDTRDAPMSGERLFEAHAVLEIGPSTDVGDLRRDLERLANELMVEIAITTTP